METNSTAASDETEVRIVKITDQGQISTEILLMLFMLMLSITFGHFLKRSGHKYLQVAGLTVIIGIVCGAIMKYGLSKQTYLQDLSSHFSQIFLIILLPPIIFESGYNIKKKPFFKNLGSVLIFSFLGTFIAIFTSSLLFMLTGLAPILSPSFTWQEAFAFGSLTSATDPVSVLATFKEMDADENLFSLVFGESIFNDAVAIVMYQTVIKSENTVFSAQKEVGLAVLNFILVFFGSLLIGIASALLIAFVTKRLQLIYDRRAQNLTDRQLLEHQKMQMTTEIAIMFLCPYVSYLIAEGLQLSGIVAILLNGIFLNYYATPNISQTSRKIASITYETVAFTAENVVFLFLGIGLFAFDHPYKQMGFAMPLVTSINLLTARFFNVVCCTWLSNTTRNNKINKKQSFVIWYSGLRGAMAYALALSCAKDFPQIGPIILIDTLVQALITILVQGSTIYPVLVRCDVKRQPIELDDISELQDTNDSRCFRLKNFVQKIDSKYIKPVFSKRVLTEDTKFDNQVDDRRNTDTQVEVVEDQDAATQFSKESELKQNI